MTDGANLKSSTKHLTRGFLTEGHKLCSTQLVDFILLEKVIFCTLNTGRTEEYYKVESVVFEARAEMVKKLTLRSRFGLVTDDLRPAP